MTVDMPRFFTFFPLPQRTFHFVVDHLDVSLPNTERLRTLNITMDYYGNIDPATKRRHTLHTNVWRYGDIFRINGRWRISHITLDLLTILQTIVPSCLTLGVSPPFGFSASLQQRHTRFSPFIRLNNHSHPFHFCWDETKRRSRVQI